MQYDDDDDDDDDDDNDDGDDMRPFSCSHAPPWTSESQFEEKPIHGRDGQFMSDMNMVFYWFFDLFDACLQTIITMDTNIRQYPQIS